MRNAILKSAVAVLVLANAGVVGAAVTPEEAKQLGTTLTPMGAEKAGNKDGTIPEYSGGLTTPPPGYKKGSSVRPDPFADEKPLFSITAQNVDQYGDRVTAGMKAILKRYPTYRMNVYPTHRTAAFPKYVVENTLANATRAKTGDGGETMSGAVGGLPFPIPKDGYEAMWNHILRFCGHGWTKQQKIYFVDASGNAVMTANTETYDEYPYYEPGRKSIQPDELYWFTKITYLNPARLAGSATLITERFDLNRNSWAYQPGQRRVRLAPDLAGDTPIAQVGGGMLYDDQNLWTGKMDRFAFKLLGKREVFIPYNNYHGTYECKGEDWLKTAKQHHLNPDCERWELHRVWVVEATLKPGKRHVYSKRALYFDEDSWASGLAETYDHASKLYRVTVATQSPSYEVPAPDMNQTWFYDMSTGVLAGWSLGDSGFGIKHAKRPAREMTPDALAGAGIR